MGSGPALQEQQCMYRTLCLLTTERSGERSLQGCLMEGRHLPMIPGLHWEIWTNFIPELLPKHPAQAGKVGCPELQQRLLSPPLQEAD